MSKNFYIFLDPERVSVLEIEREKARRRQYNQYFDKKDFKVDLN